MPPPIEEYESDSEDLDTIPARSDPESTRKTKVVEKAESIEDEDEAVDEPEEVTRAGDNDDEEDEDDSDSETFVVEMIREHDWSENGTCLYKVKWQGYEKKADETWEPLENLAGAMDMVEKYHKKIGGAPVHPTKASASRKGRKRKAESEVASPAPNSSKKKTKTEKTNGASRDLPPGSWEDEIESIETIEELANKSVRGSNKSSLMVYMKFNNGYRGSISMTTVRQKCPQKLLDYYEQHLSFRENQVPRVDGGADDDE